MPSKHSSQERSVLVPMVLESCLPLAEASVQSSAEQRVSHLLLVTYLRHGYYHISKPGDVQQIV